MFGVSKTFFVVVVLFLKDVSYANKAAFIQY